MAATPSQNDIVTAVTNSLVKKDLSKQAVAILSKSTEKVLARIKQNVDVQIKEDSSPIVEEFVANVATKLSNTSQQWIDSTKNDMLVFPEGTKYIFRDGNVSTIIVEQAPQLRHITTVDIGEGHRKHTYMLAMPYVQFVISFTGDEVQKKLVVSCTKKSITSLEEKTYQVPLLNIADHVVCFGTNWPKGGNMTEKVNHVIGEFWQGLFNGNHTGAFIDFINSNFRGDSSSSYFIQNGLERWETGSKQDALFMVKPTTKLLLGKPLNSFLQRDGASKNGSGALMTKLKQEIIQAVGTIGGDIHNLLTNMDLQTENRDKVHVENIQETIKEIIVQAYKELWTFTEKQLETDRKKLQDEMQIAAQKLKKDFDSYMKDRQQKTW